jgi:hypothetical protein
MSAVHFSQISAAPTPVFFVPGGQMQVSSGLITDTTKPTSDLHAQSSFKTVLVFRVLLPEGHLVHAVVSCWSPE